MKKSEKRGGRRLKNRRQNMKKRNE